MEPTTCTYVIGRDQSAREKLHRSFEATGLGAAWQADSLHSLMPPHVCYPEPNIVLVDITHMAGDLRTQLVEIQKEYPGATFLLMSEKVTSALLMEYLPIGIGGVLPLDIDPQMLRYSLELLLDDTLMAMN
ncbi:MAG: hypothetical protein AAF563_03035 [Pseudomonadota bacterium]